MKPSTHFFLVLTILSVLGRGIALNCPTLENNECTCHIEERWAWGRRPKYVINCHSSTEADPKWNIRATFDRICPAFADTEFVGELHISNKPIRTIPAKAFSTCGFELFNLTNLYNLRTISPRSLSDTSALEFLILSNLPRLRNPNEVFDLVAKMPKLQRADLENTGLTFVPERAFEKNQKLGFINLDQNPLTNQSFSPSFHIGARNKLLKITPNPQLTVLDETRFKPFFMGSNRFWSLTLHCKDPLNQWMCSMPLQLSFSRDFVCLDLENKVLEQYCASVRA